MGRELSETSFDLASPHGLQAPDRSIAGPWGVALLALGWSIVIAAHAVGSSFADPASGVALLLVGVMVVASLIAIGAGCAIAITAAESPDRHVFHSRPAFRTTVVMLLGGVVVVVALIIRGPFDRIVSNGGVTANTVADLGCILAAIVAFVGGGVAAFAWWDAHQDERTWFRGHAI